MRLLLISLLICVNPMLFAQDTTIAIKVAKTQQAIDSRADNAKIYYVVDQMPTFPGGDDSLMVFIHRNLEYPPVENTYGRVVVQFIVNEDGRISDIKVVRSVHKSLDAEVVRVIKLFPRFLPGRQQGKAVRVRYVLPVMFGHVD